MEASGTTPAKAIKEEVVEGKETTGAPHSPSQPQQSSADHKRNRGMRSPGSPSGGEGGTTPPCPPSATPPAVALSASLMPSPPSTSPPATRPKLKRFLSTLVQFAGEIAPELGDRVRNLIFSLVNGSVTIEEFHASLQEMTNFPLRPFVLPFLRNHLPLLQREVATQARLAKQTVSQFLRHHEQMVLDPSCSPSEPSEIFHSEIANTPTTTDCKRRHSDTSIYENGIKEADNSEPPNKRERLLAPSAAAAAAAANLPLLFNPLAPLNAFHPSALSLGGYSGLLNSGLPLLGLQPTPQGAPPPHLLSNSTNSNSNSHNSSSNNELSQDRLQCAGGGKDDRSADEEWKNINTMLNCILSMVEKTKRALSILQTRDRTVTSESDVKRAANEIIRITEDRIGEIKRRAEEAVHEVKRQAMIELERLIVKNCKTREEIEDAVMDGISHQNLCWNCGRKAHETCSGCNVARYCGALCQHRDWENHHQLCCTLERRQREEHHHRRNSSSCAATDENHNKGLLITDSSNTIKDDKRNVLNASGDDLKDKSRSTNSMTSNQLLSIDNIRRLKNQVESRSMRSTPPSSSASASTVSSMLDK